MTGLRNIAITGFIFFLVFSDLWASGDLTDPYKILDNNFNAMGGLDRLKAEKTYIIEGRISFASLEGDLKIWVRNPDRYRYETDLGILKLVQGDNGEYQWIVDSNDKLQLITNPDEATVKRKEVKRRMTEYEYFDRDSEIFRVTLAGIDTVYGRDCYMIKIENSINNDVTTYYINTATFLMDKSVSIEADNSNDTYYKDYREIDGLKFAFYNNQIPHQTGQPQEITFTEYLSNPQFDQGVFEPPQQTEKDYEFLEGNSAEDIPFRFIDNHLYIPVTMGCDERLWILDTGASMSVIDQEYASELGLETEGEITGTGAGGNVSVKLTNLPSFKLNNIIFKDQTVAVIDMAVLNRILGLETAGILGYDFLSRFVTKVDYANELVSFYDPDIFEYTGTGNELPVHLKNGVFMVKAVLDGGHSGTWLFDLGAGSVALDGVYAYKNGISERKGIEGLGRGAGNTFGVKRVKFDWIEFAGFTVNNPIVTFAYGSTDTVFISDEIGTLGNSLFRNFVIYCDYANERLIVEKGDNFGIDFPENYSGLQLTLDDQDNIRVFYVADKTSAHKAGFKIDDIILGINNIGIEYFDGITALREMLREQPGTKYKFLVERDGRQKKIELKLEDFF